MIYYLYATPDALEVIEHSNMATMQMLVNNAFGKTAGCTYTVHLAPILQALPHIIWIRYGQMLDMRDKLIYMGYYDTETGKGRNAYEVMEAREVIMNG